MPTVASLWRHPIKSHGREALETVTLIEGQTMPFDRHWAVTHPKTKFDPSTPRWEKCRNFVIGALNPGVAGIWAQFDETTGIMYLRHQTLGEISFDPNDPADSERFLTWATPAARDGNPPTALVSAGERGMTDTPFPSISIMNNASHNAVAEQLGHPLEIERWRGNIWLEGLDAWAEWDWIGQDVRIGQATLHIADRCTRCNHTKANPVTGQRDIDTLNALDAGWGHNDFGIYAEVVTGGAINVGDTVEVL